MNIARFLWKDKVQHGVVEGNQVYALRGDLFGEPRRGRRLADLSQVKLLAPIVPPKMLAMALNYRTHVREERPMPPNPELFWKPPTSVIGPEDSIILHPGATNVHYESELVVVMKRRAHKVSEAEALDYVLGYTCGNDVSCRNWQFTQQGGDMQWWRAKGADTFSPLGPVIVTGADWTKFPIVLRLNGEVKQTCVTGDMHHPVPKIISFASQAVTLEPGDCIFTGTSGATTAMKPGDVVEVDIKGIGVLRNYVRAA
ncbi:MAG: fumarylacetoacetate hydrolase family protein [Chloroflexi bacterium]|nr:fumarylacetoacetate hydrolase family protein [Chloroflexota bacterium]